MSTVAIEALERAVAPACAELFADWNISLRLVDSNQVPPANFEAHVGGVAAFAGPAVRGSLLLVSTFDLVARARPPELRTRPLSSSSSADWLLVRDWSMELANQLLGRVKNRVYGSGLLLTIKNPTAVSGVALAIATKSYVRRPFVFASTEGNVWLWYVATIDGTSTPGGAGGRSPAGPKEGDILLF